MKCLVVGGGGFIGSHLSDALLDQGHEVTVLDRPAAPYLEGLGQKGASLCLGNFQESDPLRVALKDVEVLFHMASTTVPTSSNQNPIADIQDNLIGTLQLFDLAHQAGVRKVVFPSSGGTVYGVPRETPIAEDHPTDPICSYGIAKLAIEKYAHLYWTLHGLDYAILRISNAYGERQVVNASQGIIPMLIYRGLREQEISIWGDGSVIRDYIHVSDIVAAFLKGAAHRGETRLFNIGSGTGRSIHELIRTIEEFVEKPLKVVYEPGRAYDVPVNILDISRANRSLGWQPSLSLQDGIKRTVAYLRTHL